LARARRVNELANRFEDAWKAGQRPRIEDYVADRPEVERAALLRELIGVEVYYRRLLGEDPKPEDYYGRFPALERGWLAGVVASATPRIAPPPTAAAPESTVLAEGARGPAARLRRIRCPHCHNPIQLDGLIGPPTASPSDGLLDMIGLLRALVAAYPNPVDASADRVRAALAHAAQALARAGPSVATPDYEILEPVGRGGMGIVYKAWQPTLKRIVALKVLMGGAAPPDRRERFRIEAEAVARLRHPNIVQIHAIGEGADGPWLALEWVEGGGLDRRLRQGLLAVRVAAELVRALAYAVQHAHAAEIVHRDLKPANVLLTADGTPKIADFGLARFLGDAEGLTRTGDLLGTAGYMAPEQAAGRAAEAGPAADVWALGAILYECLTGRKAFDAPTWQDAVRQVLEEEPPVPRRLRGDVPGDLEAVCLKCLCKAPAYRYATAQELAEDLDRWLSGEPVRARAPSLWRRADRWLRRLPDVGGAGLAILCVGTTIAVALAASWQLAAVALTIFLAGYSAMWTGQRAVALGTGGSATSLLSWTVVGGSEHSGGIPTGVVPLVVAGPTLLAALASAWWRSRRLLKALLPAAFAGLVLLITAERYAVRDLSYYEVRDLSYLAVGVFIVCGIMRAVARYFAAPFVAVALGFLCGGVVGGGCPGVVILAVFTKQVQPFQALVIVGFVTAGGLFGAVAGAARRRGARTDFGVYPNPGSGPAVEVPQFKGPPLRFSASQLRGMADLLDRHGQSFQVRPLVVRPLVVRPLVGRPTATAPLPADDTGNPAPDEVRPEP
jgi:hypothetical protein